MHLAAAYRSKNSTKNQSLGVVLPARAYYRDAQISAVGAGGVGGGKADEAHHAVDDGGHAGRG